MVVFIFVAVFGLVIFAVLVYFKWIYGYWKRLGVPYLEPKIPFGTAQNLTNPDVSPGDLVVERYLTAKAKGYKYLGLFSFTRPEFMPIDQEIIKNVLVKDFNHFSDRGFYQNEPGDPLSGSLFFLGPPKSKRIRSCLSPTFSSGKIKMMTDTIIECAQHLKLEVNSRHEQGSLQIKDFFSRFGTDVIGRCAFGLECNSFTDPQSAFCRFSRRIFEPTTFEHTKEAFTAFFPSLSKFLRLKVIPNDVTNFFLSTVEDVVKQRKKAGVERNDFLQLLMGLMDDGELTLEEVTAQSFGFFLAGFDTSSTALMFCFFELASNQDIQLKVRDEINSVLERHGGKMTYEALGDMVYMRQVLEEVMRKYPPVPILNRVCTSDYKIPNTNVTIRKGTLVLIPVYGIQNDPEIYPRPHKFDPDRFSSANKEALQYCFLPFGEGPRICMGLRFAFLQMKIVLTTLIKHYRFFVSDRTQMPLKMNPKSFILSPIGSIWLDAKKV